MTDFYKLQNDAIRAVLSCSDEQQLSRLMQPAHVIVIGGEDRPRNRFKMYQGFGRKATAAEWAHMLGLPRNTVWRYLQKGLTPEEIAAYRHIELMK